MQQNRNGKNTGTADTAPAGKLFLPLVAITFADMSLLGFLNSMRGVSFPLIKTGFGASYSQMGFISAAASFATVCSCVLAGMYMNRFGPKRTVAAAFVCVSLAAGSFHFASAFWIAALIYLALQAGSGFFEIGLNGTGVKIFTVKSGLMMNLLHFFYGVGAVAGPRFMGLMINRAGFRWQDVYPLALVPVFLLFAATLMIRYPGPAAPPSGPRKEAQNLLEGKISFWTMLKDPMIWLFGSILGVSGAIEGCSVSWSGLYLFDVYGLDPSTTGAVFVSAFYVLFTVSRFLSGFVIEKTGYMRSLLAAAAAILILFAVAFSLGRPGIYLLPAVGFFVAIMWPTLLAVGVGVFRERAQTASSAMIPIAFTLTGFIQYGFGLSNRFLGAAWAYRSCVLYSLILVFLLLLLVRQIKLTGGGVK